MRVGSLLDAAVGVQRAMSAVEIDLLDDLAMMAGGNRRGRNDCYIR
jgi:hypothetical protein